MVLTASKRIKRPCGVAALVLAAISDSCDIRIIVVASRTIVGNGDNWTYDGLDYSECVQPFPERILADHMKSDSNGREFEDVLQQNSRTAEAPHE